MKKKMAIVVSSPMTVKAFLQGHIDKLREKFDLSVIANCVPEELGMLDKSVRIIPVPVERKISITRDLKALWILYRLFRLEKFDVVHSVTPKAGLLAMSAGFLARVKYRIHTFTGQVWATKTGGKRTVLKCFDKILAALTTSAFVDSPSQREFLIKEKVVSAGKSKVLADGSISGVDIERFSAAPETRKRIRGELGIGENQVVFIFLGRLNLDKGVMDLVAAFSKIIAGRDVILLIAGPDEAGIKEKMLEALGEEQKRLIFVGYTSRPEDYMNAADVFCLPSYREGFGSVVIEAAAVGIPAVGSNIYGVSDAIADGLTGFLHEAGNPDDLAAKMAELADNPELRTQFGQNARRRAEELFPSERLSDALLEEYIKLLDIK